MYLHPIYTTRCELTADDRSNIGNPTHKTRYERQASRYKSRHHVCYFNILNHIYAVRTYDIRNILICKYVI